MQSATLKAPWLMAHAINAYLARHESYPYSRSQALARPAGRTNYLTLPVIVALTLALSLVCSL